MKIYQRQLEECYRKSEEMRQLIEEVMGDIDDLAQRHHIF